MNFKEDLQLGKESSLQNDIEFKGKDSLSNESADEFYEIAEHWDEFSDPVKQLNGWCEHYYGRKHIPINFALKLWENENRRDAVWPYVKEVFQDYKDKLNEYSATFKPTDPEVIEDIKKRLETSEK